MHRFALAAISVEDAAGTVLRDAPSAGQARDVLLDILDRTVLGAIATVTADGRPHVNTVYFTRSDDLDIYFLSHPASLHCRNVSIAPSTAMAVFPSEQRWAESDRGVQLFGACEQASGLVVEAAERCYGSRFEGYAPWKAKLGPDDPARAYRFFRFRPVTVKLLDEKNLGDGVFVRACIERK